MKNLTKLLFLAVFVLVASCEKEKTEEETTLQEREILLENEIIVSDGQEDPELIFTPQSEEMREGVNMGFSNTTSGATVVQTYNVIDADRAPFGSQQPTSNFWWSESPDADDYFDASTYFSQNEDNQLTFTEYSNGTANITGSTVRGTCVVTLNVWLKNKKSFAEWSAIGGEHKKEGTAGNASNSDDMNFYVIDHTRSTVSAAGGDCVQEGNFGLTQRPDPNDPDTPNFGAHVGPGGANYDSNVGADGLSTWGWLIDPVSCDPLWLIDFNFRIEVAEDECNDCIGKVTDLTLNWDWHNDYRVRVYQRYENTCYATKIFDETVGAGENFSFSGSNHDGSLGKWAYIYVGNCYYTKIRTNCDLNIGPGYVKGVLEVVSGNSSQGGELCEYVKEDNKCHRHWYCYYNLDYCYYYY
ncbi:hypothetical protein [Winogradskyella ursingii]|uniref:hypothetical protein n=1 Tax=Winogradskyella ursingii TaxID=2686079 RepID=UPI0015CD55F0|nr:hypothetical protein [Winogradskyella ursingii]